MMSPFWVAIVLIIVSIALLGVCIWLLILRFKR